MTPNEKPASPTQGELAVKGVADLLRKIRSDRGHGAGWVGLLELDEIDAALSALDRTTLPPTEGGAAKALRLLAPDQGTLSPVDRLRLYATDPSTFEFSEEDALGLVDVIGEAIAALLDVAPQGKRT